MYHYTIDLEIYDPMKKDPAYWKEYIALTRATMEHLFGILRDNGIRITCFVTSDFIEFFPDSFKEWIAPYHEIGCHTSTHYYYDGRNKVEFVRSIEENKNFIEREIGRSCRGFRSPGTLIPKDLISHLDRCGFNYDSSVLPGIVPGRHFNLRGIRRPYRPSMKDVFVEDRSQMRVLELPLAVTRRLKLSMNGLFMPYFFNLDQAISSDEPVITYIHLSDYSDIKGKSYFWDRCKQRRKSEKLFGNLVEELRGKDISLEKNIGKGLSDD